MHQSGPDLQDFASRLLACLIGNEVRVLTHVCGGHVGLAGFRHQLGEHRSTQGLVADFRRQCRSWLLHPSPARHKNELTACFQRGYAGVLRCVLRGRPHAPRLPCCPCRGGSWCRGKTSRRPAHARLVYVLQYTTTRPEHLRPQQVSSQANLRQSAAHDVQRGSGVEVPISEPYASCRKPCPHLVPG